MWHQRCHLHWMVSKDKNTGYFHKRDSQKFRRNNISKLWGLNGELHSGDDKIASLLMDYYQQLFSSSNPSGVNEVVQYTKQVVTNEMSSFFIVDLSKLEVETTLKQMVPLKAPGPNDMPPIFFQYYWCRIGEDVVKTVLSCLNSGRILPGLNHTFITLIPKVKGPEKISEFCFITV